MKSLRYFCCILDYIFYMSFNFCISIRYFMLLGMRSKLVINLALVLLVLKLPLPLPPPPLPLLRHPPTYRSSAVLVAVLVARLASPRLLSDPQVELGPTVLVLQQPVARHSSLKVGSEVTLSVRLRYPVKAVQSACLKPMARLCLGLAGVVTGLDHSVSVVEVVRALEALVWEVTTASLWLR